MTCVAVRDGVMAADSRTTGDFISATIKLYRQDGAIIGFCGNVEQSLVFVDWYQDRKQRKPDLANEADWCALILTREGLEWWGASLRPIPVYDKFCAIGSGAQFAMGAMEMGASAKKAVEIACRRDQYCAPPVVTMRLRK